MRIWKYELASSDNTIQMPAGSQVLTAQSQHGRPCLWAEVDPDLRTESRRFVVKTTGEAFNPRGLTYVGTVQVEGGLIVLHVYEATP